MWPYIIEGIMLGSGLAISLGPIFVALTQTSLEKGVLPGATVGAGVWVSDIIFMVVVYKFVYQIKDNIESEEFSFWMGISGCIVLVAFGLFMLIQKPVVDYTKRKHDYKNYIGFWLKGFLINTLNPFTFFFWISVLSSYMIGRQTEDVYVITLIVTILIIIIISDLLKVLLANYLRQKLTVNHIDLITNASGLILLGVGIYFGYMAF